MIIDTHAHLDFKHFQKDLPNVLARAKNAGITKIITIGIDIQTSIKAIELAEENEGVYATVGIHPHEADTATVENIETLKRLASNEKVIAIGECGLDYVRSQTSRDEQFGAFETQMALAEALSLPIVVHSRESYDDVYQILYKYSGKVAGVIHCMSGDSDFRDRVLDMGYYIAIGGPITYPDNHDLRSTISGVPLDRLLVETDCPFLPPQSKRPGRNEPAYLVEVVDRLAEIYGKDHDAIEAVTTSNAIKAFRLTAK